MSSLPNPPFLCLPADASEFSGIEVYLGSFLGLGSFFVGGVWSPQLSLQFLPALSLCLVA